MSVKKDTFYNIIGNSVPLLSAVALIPYLTRELGAERFGFMTIMWALIGYFGIFDLGVSRALTYFATRANDPHNPEPLAPAVKAGMQVVGIAGVVGLVLVGGFSNTIAHKLLEGNLALLNEAVGALLITALIIPFTALGNGLRGVLEGLGHFKDVALIKAVTGSVFFIAPALLVYCNQKSLLMISVVFFLTRMITSLWCWIAVKNSLQYSSTKKIPVKKEHRSKLLSYGVWALTSSIISPLMVYGDRFIISSVLGAQMVGIYAVLQEMMGRTVILSASFASALLPRFAADEGESLIESYKKSNLVIVVIMAIFYCVFWSLAQPLAEIWLGKSLEEYKIIFALFSFALFLNSIAQLPFFFLHSKGVPEVPAKFHLIEFVVYVPCCIAATVYYGLVGAATAWVVRVLFDWVLLQWAAKKILG